MKRLQAVLLCATLAAACGESDDAEAPAGNTPSKAAAITTAAAEPPVLAPEGPAWSVTGAQLEEDEANNLSGLACATGGGGQSRCLAVNDELGTARWVALQNPGMIAGEALTLLPKPPGKKKIEADTEAVAFSGGRFYAVSSHGQSKKGKVEDSRFFLYRVSADGASVERSNRLRAAIAGADHVGSHAEQPLNQHGVNVEGAAVHDGNIFVGFRGPVLDDGKAYVMKVAETEAFGTGTATAKVDALALNGLGIRDLARVDGGFLILTGAEQDEGAGEPALYFWRGEGTEVRPLGRLGGERPKDAMPEGLLVLSEAADAYRVLVLHDGPAGGAPTAYRVPKAP